MSISKGDFIKTGRGLAQVLEIDQKVLIKLVNTNSVIEISHAEANKYTIMNNIYTVTIESPFLLTQTQVKNKLGIGYKVVALETLKDLPAAEINDVDSAIEAIIKTGYRALARANHPDFGGSAVVMSILNRAKKEVNDLIDMIKGEK